MNEEEPESEMDAERITQAARLLLQARGDHRQIDGLPEECRPETLDEGYAIQDELARLWELESGGWKVGAATPYWQERVGAPSPVAGRMFAPFIFESPAEFYGGAFHVRIVESEYAFRLARDLPPREAAYERAEVEDAIETLHPAIELVDSRYKGGLDAGAFSLVADNALAAAFVYTDPIPDWRDQDLTNRRVRLLIDGAVMAEGTGEDVGGHPILPLIWLANDRSRRGDGLLAGQFITTSSVTGIHQAPAECEVVADFGAFGEVRVTFTG